MLKLSDTAVVLGAENAVAYNSLFALKDAGLKTIAVSDSPKRLLTAFSRNCDQNSSWLHFSGLASASDQTPVFFSNDRAVQRFRSMPPSEQRCWRHFSGLDIVCEKDVFFAKLTEQKIPHAFTQSAAEYFKSPFFPAIARPVDGGGKHPFYSHYRRKALRLDNREDVAKLQEALKEASKSLFFQSFVSLKSSEWSVAFSSLGPENSFFYSIQHLLKVPDQLGRVAKSALVPNQQLEEIARKTVAELGLLGIGDVQFGIQKDSNKPIVLEVNPRAWTGHELLLKNGINLFAHQTRKVHSLPSPPAPSRVWQSSLNLRNDIKLLWNNDEFLDRSEDTLLTRLTIRFFLIFRIVAYFMTGRI